MNRRTLLTLAAARLAGAAISDSPFELALRTRTEAGAVATLREKFNAAESAMILCDMWDSHWCKGAVMRVNQMVPRFVPVLTSARRAGFTVIHAPSDTMGFYANSPQRRKMTELARAATPEPRALPSPALPIDDSAGGCDTSDKFFKAWSRQHAGIPIDPADYVSDKGEEVYSLLKLRGIRTLFVAGVHTNMCILNRTFAIKQMTRWGVRCILLRDLTDSMYDPQAAPFVSHERGTELVIEHIERHWCPSALSTDLLAALSAGERDRRPSAGGL